MHLRLIKGHNYRVLALEDLVAGVSVRSALLDAKRVYPRLFERAVALLFKQVPTFGPPYNSDRPDEAKAKYLYDGLWEFVILDRERGRRQRAKQPQDEKATGLRIFFYRYGSDVICLSACYKTTTTPPEAIPDAMKNMEAAKSQPLEERAAKGF